MPCACTCHQQATGSPYSRELVSLRTAVIALIALVFGIGSGTLTFWANGGNLAGAVLAGLGTAALTFVTLHVLIN